MWTIGFGVKSRTRYMKRGTLGAKPSDGSDRVVLVVYKCIKEGKNSLDGGVRPSAQFSVM